MRKKDRRGGWESPCKSQVKENLSPGPFWGLDYPNSYGWITIEFQEIV